MHQLSQESIDLKFFSHLVSSGLNQNSTENVYKVFKLGRMVLEDYDNDDDYNELNCGATEK